MAGYIPKSKVSILKTTGLEFVKLSNNEPYQGDYIEFSNGTFYAGNNSSNLGEQLIKRVPLSNNFESGANNSQYKELKRRIHNNLSRITVIPPFKPVPTSNDIDRGYLIRYFCKRVNEQINYFEISKKTYDLLQNKDPKYDYNLYTIGNLRWALIETNSISQEEINKNILDSKQKDFPFINLLFSNLSEFAPLYTDGTEFVTRSGKREIPYVGFYHNHPNFGFAMVGAYHIEGKHKRLFSPKKQAIGEIRETSEKPLSEIPTRTSNEGMASTPSPSIPPPSRTVSRPSYGGGGGY